MNLMRPMILVVILCLGVTLSLAAQPLSGQVVPVETITPIIAQSEATYHVRQAVVRPVIDGKADEWRDVPTMVLDRKAQSKGKWDGPDDLSGSLRLQWDEQALYFCLQVTDDSHNVKTPDPARSWYAFDGWWANDCCQFSFDPYLNGPIAVKDGWILKDGFDEDELTFCVSDSAKGPVMASYRQRGDTRDTERLIPDQTVKMTVGQDGVRVYEWAVPWARLAPVSPWVLGHSGFTFTLNENDGKGFEGAMMWTPGLLYGQDASKFGRIIFDGAEGAQNGALALHPEPKLLAKGTASRWLNPVGVEPFDAARLLVRADRPGPVKASLHVYRQGERTPCATGLLRHEMPADRAVAFVWDLSALTNGRYELVFNVTGASKRIENRLSYRHWSTRGVEELASRKAQLRERFGLDRPWDEMADAPAMIRRHRGIVAAMLQWLDPAEPLRDDERLKALSNAAEMMRALDAGTDYLAGRRNEFWCAYYSPADGTGQHFVVGVPANFNPRKAYPLVVWLHGSNGRPVPEYDAVQEGQYIEVRPWGRGDCSYMGLGEDDVLRVVAYMKQWYKIDERRVYATGRSMGGSGAWILPARHPDLFAASTPICGAGDGMPLENLLHVPVFNQHGQEDWVVGIDYSRFVVSKLQQLGYSVVHNEVPKAGHTVHVEPGFRPIYDWMLQHRRPERPDAVTYTCDTPDNGRAYWLTIRRFIDPHQPAKVNARVNGKGINQTLTLLADNTEAVECDVSAMPVDRNAPLLVQCGYTLLTLDAPLPARFFVLRQGDAWSLAPAWTAPATDMRPYRAGAAANLYGGEPLLIVYGTQGDEKRTALLRVAAESVAGTAWASHTINGRFPIKADRAVTADDLIRFNLVLIGGASENSVVARMAEKLPFKVNEKHELIAGDRAPVSLDGAGVRLAYFNPLAPQRLIFLIATDDTGEGAETWLKEAKNLVTGARGWERLDMPDLVVQSLDGADRRRMRFTHGWQWRTIAGAECPLPEKMASRREMALARARVMRRAAGADFALWWGGDAIQANECDPRWFTLADMAAAQQPGQTLRCRMSGQELIDLHAGWISTDKVLVTPSYDPKDIDPKRAYHIAMPPDMCWLSSQRKANLSDVEAGPDWRAEDLWQEVFGL